MKKKKKSGPSDYEGPSRECMKSGLPPWPAADTGEGHDESVISHIYFTPAGDRARQLYRVFRPDQDAEVVMVKSSENIQRMKDFIANINADKVDAFNKMKVDLKSGGLSGPHTMTMNIQGMTPANSEFLRQLQSPISGHMKEVEKLIRDSPWPQRIGYIPEAEEQKQIRLKIAKLQRAIRLVDTFEMVANTAYKAADIISGKTTDPFREDAQKIHESIKELPNQQINELVTMHQQQGQNVATSEEKTVTFDDQLSMFVHSCLWQIQEQKEELERMKKQMAFQDKTVSEYQKNSAWEKSQLEKRIESQLARVNGDREAIEKAHAENEKLRKTIGGLRSHISKLKGTAKRTRKPQTKQAKAGKK